MNPSNPLRIRVPQITAKYLERENTNDPNLWFARMFPHSVQIFGPAFLEATYEDTVGLKRFVPLEPNIDFFAHVLGGDRTLAHQAIYFGPEGTWYFFDPRLDCFCPTTESKLEALLSSFLVRCAQEAGSLVEVRPIFSEFRKPEVLQNIVRRARAIHLTDASFFQGERGHRRMIDGKIIEPTAKPSYELFVEKTLVKEPAGAVSVTNAFHRYVTFCREHQMSPLTRQEFKSLVAAVVREYFAVGLRNDVPGQNGKAQEGWYGLRLRIRDQSALGLS